MSPILGMHGCAPQCEIPSDKSDRHGESKGSKILSGQF